MDSHIHGSTTVSWGNYGKSSTCWKGSPTKAYKYSKGGSYCRMEYTEYSAKKEEIKSCGSEYYGIVSDLDKNIFPNEGEKDGYWYIYQGSYIEK